MIEQYCTECHDAAEHEAGLVLENADLLHPAANAAVWEKVIHKLDLGLMPPPGGPRPDAATAAGLVAYLEGQLDAAAAAAPQAGAPALASLEPRRVRQRDPRLARHDGRRRVAVAGR